MRWATGFAAGIALLLAVPTAASGHHTKQTVALTGYGATRKAWAAHHRADPNPKLIRGSCFLPKQNNGQDRYFDVMYGQGRVISYEMAFGPRITERFARFLMRKELPPDAHIVGQKRKPTCEQIVYRSATLKRILGDAHVGVEFSTTGAGGRYRGVVGDVIVGFITLDIGC